MVTSVTMRLMFLVLFASASQSFVAKRSVVGCSKTTTPFLRSKNSCRILMDKTYLNSYHASSSIFSSLKRASGSFCTGETCLFNRTPEQSATALSAEAKILATERESNISLEDSMGTSRNTVILAGSPDFIKPDRDMSQYRWIKLENNLEVILVSTASDNSDSDENSGAKVEAASVHVQAGHFDDTIPGLAHFHEHMLFLGTKKYPSEDDYEGFLSAHGGFCNAYTDMEDTNYYFSVTSQQDDINETSEGLKGGLDRLANFFVEPMFEEDMVERELRAIDSEYRNGKTSDGWRNYQFLKSIANQKHPFSNFGCGNYETLSSLGTPVQELKNFWSKYYTTSNMRLAVSGCSSLDALQHAVEETFGELAFSDQSPRREKVNPLSLIFPRENAIHDPKNPAFGPEQLGKSREVIPLLESRTLKVQFLTPPVYDPELRKTRPHRVLSHLIGHESPGSLHHLLNEKGFITGLSAGAALDASDFSLFSVSLSLTKNGMKAKDKVLDLIFQWIALIKKVATENPTLLAKYHNELQQIGMMNFKFREQGNPMDFCSSASDLMFETIRPEEILVSGTKSDDYDPVIASAFMDRLSPYNCMINIVDSDLKQESQDEWEVEPLYGAVYRESVISEIQLKLWERPSVINPKLHVPALNEYIPTDFSLRCQNSKDSVTESERERTKSETPTLFFESGNFRMWHKMDRFWRVPKTFVRLSIVSPKPYGSPRSMTLSRIFQKVLNDDLNSYVYDASLAGCNYHVSCAPSGYKISVRGYSEKLPVLLETLTSRMLSLIQELKEGKDMHPGLYNRFIKAKESLLRETKNCERTFMYNFECMTYVHFCCDAPYFICCIKITDFNFFSATLFLQIDWTPLMKLQITTQGS